MNFAKLIKEFESGSIDIKEETHHYDALISSEFVSYFLDFLRTSTEHFYANESTSVPVPELSIEKSLNCYNHNNSSLNYSLKSIKSDKPFRNTGRDIQRMSTPKANDSVISPLIHKHSSTKTSNNFKNSSRPKNHTVGDYLGDSLMTRSLPRSKKLKNKGGNRRRSAPNDLKKTEASRALTFNTKDADDFFPQLITPSSDRNKKAVSRRIKPTTVQLSAIPPIKFASHTTENCIEKNPFTSELPIIHTGANKAFLGKENVSLELLSIIDVSACDCIYIIV